MAEDRPLSFAGLLRQLRTAARLTQEELAQAAGVSARAVSDLERGVNRTAHKDTARLLAAALGLPAHASQLFVSAARGRAPAGAVALCHLCPCRSMIGMLRWFRMPQPDRRPIGLDHGIELHRPVTICAYLVKDMKASARSTPSQRQAGWTRIPALAACAPDPEWCG